MKNQTTTRNVTYEQTRGDVTDFITVEHQATYGTKQDDKRADDEVESQHQKAKCSYKQQSSKR